MTDPVRILCIDGGGIRGIIPATLLARLEELTGRRIAEMFDLIAGTSTGGILALGLTKPGSDGRPQYSAADLAGLYKKEGHKIFDLPTWRRIANPNSLLDEKYPCAGIEEMLEDYFGEAKLSEALCETLITSYEIERRMPFFFRSSRAQVNPEYDYLMKHAGRATSAAPTYFEPSLIQAVAQKEKWALIDGGVFANNPTMCALIEARTRWAPKDYLVVSLGTGSLENIYPYAQAKSWGLIGWARPMLNILLDGVNATVDYQARELLPEKEGTKRYYRFQAKLNPNCEEMDNASPENIVRLKQVAASAVTECGADLERLAQRLTLAREAKA